ncbi:hypothetical protein [Pseudomonas sp. IT-P260]|uniref:hypothetical protein n=1 Tax=Pseudomonas sp. IT-P260 TaxID=3026457 RepID=UPI0039E1F386
MQMSETAEVVQVAGVDNANTLLAVVPSANNEGKVHVAYVLGKTAEKPKTDWKKMSE